MSYTISINKVATQIMYTRTIYLFPYHFNQIIPIFPAKFSVIPIVTKVKHNSIFHSTDVANFRLGLVDPLFESQNDYYHVFITQQNTLQQSKNPPVLLPVVVNSTPEYAKQVIENLGLSSINLPIRQIIRDEFSFWKVFSLISLPS